MPVRIHDIALKLGLENKDILAKAKEMGIAAAKVPSSSLDKISAEWLEEEIIKSNPTVAARLAARSDDEKIIVINAPPKPQITITATGAELYRLVERILNQEVQLHFSISETELGEPLRFRLTNDPVPKPSDSKPKHEPLFRAEISERTKDLLRAAYYASRHNSTEGWVNLAEYGNAVKRLDPTFQPQDFGERGLGSLLCRVTDVFELRNDESNPIVYYLRMKEEKFHSIPQVPVTPSRVPPTIVAASPKLARGKVHNLRLGFGFIMPDDGSENLFFHATDVEGCTIFDLKPGDAVEYEPGVNEKGPCGRKVRRLA